MKHRVIANLISSKIPTGVLVDVSFFEDQNIKHNPTPQLRISGGKKCEAEYKHSNNIEIRSPYYMSTEVYSDNETLIEDLAKEKFNQCINNLSLLLDDFWGEYIIVKIDTWVKNEWKTVWSIFSEATRLSISVDPIPLGSDENSKLKKLMKIEDKIYKKSLHYLSEGEKRLNKDLTRDKDRVDAEAFLNLFKPIELISNELCKEENQSIPNKIILKFIVNLFFLGKEKSIKNFLNSYKTIKIQSTKDKIKKTGQILGINKNLVSETIEYYTYRSELDIAHAHKSFSKRTVDYGNLSRLTRLFVRKYLQKSKQLSLD